MFERGPHGYILENVIWDEIVFISLGYIMVMLGIWLLWHEEKLEGLAPILGLFLAGPGAIMMGGSIMWLCGITT